MMKSTFTTDIQKLEALTRQQVTNISLLEEWREQSDNRFVHALIDELMALLEGRQQTVTPLIQHKGLQELDRLVNLQNPFFNQHKN